MTRTIEYREDLGVVLVKTSGIYRLGLEIETVRNAIRSMDEHDCPRCLFDNRNATVIAPTIEAFNRSEVYKSSGFKPNMRLASLVNEITEELEFYETATCNRGFKVKVFDDYIAAIAWLKS